ncbi:MAG: O-antigen ligase family protein [Gemmatimonadales bacterium]
MTTVAYIALWLFCFAVPWENIIVIPGLGTISKLFGIVAMGVAVLAALSSARVRRIQPFHAVALLFVMWAGLGAFYVADEARGLNKFGTYFQLFLVLWMIWELAGTPKRQLGLLFAYVCGAIVAATNTIMVYRSLLGSEKYVRRFSAEGFDPNDLGMTLALALPMAWYLGMTYRQPIMRWLCRGYLPLGLVAIGLTGSRGALLASIVALLIVPLSVTQLSRAKVGGAIVLLLLSVVVAVAFIPTASWDRFATTGSEVAAGNMNNRMTIWKAGFRAFTQRPIVGYGTSGFNWTVHSQPHNAYLAVLVENGLIGLALYLSMFLALFLKLFGLPTLERRFTLVLLATLGVALFPLGWEDRKPVWFVLGIVAAFTQGHLAAMAGAAWQQVARRPASNGRGGQRRPRMPLGAPVRNAERGPRT